MERNCKPLELNASEHYVHADNARLQQVFWNILRNAIKFTEIEGKITATTSNDKNGNIVIAISDTGIGMTRETISRMFLPFEQADPNRKSRYGGLGPGMAISSALVELLNGKLSAKSEGLGRGSTFTVTLPTVGRRIDPKAGEVPPAHDPRKGQDPSCRRSRGYGPRSFAASFEQKLSGQPKVRWLPHSRR